MSQVVNNNVTKKIASLAKLKLQEGEIEQFTQELGKIIDFVAQLSEVNTTGVEPLIHGVQLDPRFREDVAIAMSEEETRRILGCAEQSLYDQYKVPQVIGGE